ncbi:MAG TPA: ERCC4 domain-containing protein, partial [Candidatus Nanoarchaeia archaeon]|nr:ERCC4 domain-containing protein [Candidatus Nanoarchaeia archaeon]
HKATGEYAYTFLAKQYLQKADYPRILALTASPGSDMTKITEICSNLGIEDIEVRTDNDSDVKPYVQEIAVDWIKVQLPMEFNEVRGFLAACFRSKLQDLKRIGYLTHAGNDISKKELLLLQGQLHGELSQGIKDMSVLRAISLVAEAIKVQHALDLIETQGLSALQTYMRKLEEEAAKGSSKAVQNLMRDANFKAARVKAETVATQRIEHPKLTELANIITRDLKPGAKAIVFTQYRDSATKIHETLQSLTQAKVFVGQAKRGATGMSQKIQKEILDDFRRGAFNVLIATSVAEEGLDIPKVDLVVFYEPIPSAIRHIQRRGRTGRQERGKVIVLMAADTRDVGSRWIAQRKEKRMHTTLLELKQRFHTLQKPKRTLTKYLFPDMEMKVIADHREKASGIIRQLVEFGVKVELQQLTVGDYLLSSRCGVEFKTTHDFVDSIIDGRLLEQIKELKRNFERPLIIVEGNEDIYSLRKIHPNAIRGMLATIGVSYGIPLLMTKTAQETAELLAIIAKREQEETSRDYSAHGSKKPMSTKELQEYIVSALPGVGAGLAKPLLREFKSVRNVVNASAEELQKVDKIGEKKAKEIRGILDGEWGE